jgi:hypothetical protein
MKVDRSLHLQDHCTATVRRAVCLPSLQVALLPPLDTARANEQD